MFYSSKIFKLFFRRRDSAPIQTNLPLNTISEPSSSLNSINLTISSNDQLDTPTLFIVNHRIYHLLMNIVLKQLKKLKLLKLILILKMKMMKRKILMNHKIIHMKIQIIPIIIIQNLIIVQSMMFYHQVHP